MGLVVSGGRRFNSVRHRGSGELVKVWGKVLEAAGGDEMFFAYYCFFFFFT